MKPDKSAMKPDKSILMESDKSPQMKPKDDIEMKPEEQVMEAKKEVQMKPEGKAQPVQKYPFVTTIGDDGVPHVRMTERDMTKSEMMNLSRTIPDVMRNAYSPTPEQLKEANYTELKDKQVRMHSYYDCKGRKGYSKSSNELEHDHLQYFSPQKMHELGLMENMLKLRAGYSKQERLRMLQNCVSAPALKKRGNAFDMNFSVQPTNAPNSIRISPVAKAGDPELNELNHIVAKTAFAVAMAYASEPVKEMWQERWAAESSVCFGWEDNWIFSNFQLNLTHIDPSKYAPDTHQLLSATIKGKGDVHIDKSDDATKVTVMLFASNLPEDFHPGNFFVTSTRFFCPAAFGGALVFSGRHPHSGSAPRRYPVDLPMDSPLRYIQPKNLGIKPLDEKVYAYSRVGIPVYATQSLMRARVHQFNDNLWEKEGIEAFSTIRNQKETEMRINIKKSVAALKSITDSGNDPLESNDPKIRGLSKTVDEWCDAYTWESPPGVLQKPRAWIAEFCLEVSGKSNREYDIRKEAILSTTCGIALPHLGEAEKGPKSRIAVQGTRMLKKRGELPEDDDDLAEKITCNAITSNDGKRCSYKFWRFPNGPTKCFSHRVQDKGAAAHDFDEAALEHGDNSDFDDDSDLESADDSMLVAMPETRKRKAYVLED